MVSWRSKLLLLALGLGCGTLPPLRGKIDVGHESYAVFVGGSGMGGDLFALVHHADGADPTCLNARGRAGSTPG